jgi:hypothetical protein
MFLFSIPSNKATDLYVQSRREHLEDDILNEPLVPPLNFDGTAETPITKGKRRSRKNKSKHPPIDAKLEDSEAPIAEANRPSRGNHSRSKAAAQQETEEGITGLSSDIGRDGRANSEGHNSNEICALCNERQPAYSEQLAKIPHSGNTVQPGNIPQPTRPSEGSQAETDFGCVTLDSRRTVVFSGFSEALATRLGRKLAGGWRKGMGKEKDWSSAHEVKLHGFPWGFNMGGFWGLVIRKRSTLDEIMRHMFVLMNKEGYALYLSNQDESGVGSFYFKKSRLLPKGTEEFMSISFNNPSTLRLMSAPPDFINAVATLVREKGKGKVRRLAPRKQTAESVEWNVKGYYWESHRTQVLGILTKKRKEQAIAARIFRMDLMRLMDSHGWRPYTTSDKSVLAQDEKATFWVHNSNTWHCIRD